MNTSCENEIFDYEDFILCIFPVVYPPWSGGLSCMTDASEMCMVREWNRSNVRCLPRFSTILEISESLDSASL